MGAVVGEAHQARVRAAVIGKARTRSPAPPPTSCSWPSTKPLPQLREETSIPPDRDSAASAGTTAITLWITSIPQGLVLVLPEFLEVLEVRLNYTSWLRRPPPLQLELPRVGSPVHGPGPLELGEPAVAALENGCFRRASARGAVDRPAIFSARGGWREPGRDASGATPRSPRRPSQPGQSPIEVIDPSGLGAPDASLVIVGLPLSQPRTVRRHPKPTVNRTVAVPCCAAAEAYGIRARCRTVSQIRLGGFGLYR
jgi:hypothetical protein